MRKLLVVTLIVAAALASASGAAADSKAATHCTVPGIELDLNVFYGVSHAIVAPFCTSINAGEEWSVTAGWFMNTTFAVFPSNFTPAGATPMEDFIAKFVGVKYVVDPGTAQEKTYVLKNKRHLWTGVNVFGDPLVNTLTMGTLPPLSVGQHVVRTSWLFSQMHCDGLGDVIGELPGGANCLEAGERHVSTIAFEVKAGQA